MKSKLVSLLAVIIAGAGGMILLPPVLASADGGRHPSVVRARPGGPALSVGAVVTRGTPQTQDGRTTCQMPEAGFGAVIDVSKDNDVDVRLRLNDACAVVVESIRPVSERPAATEQPAGGGTDKDGPR